MKLFLRFSVLVLALSILFQPLTTISYALPAKERQTQTSDQSTVVVKLKADADADLVNGTFVSTRMSSISQVNTVLSASKTVKKKALISDTKHSIKKNRAEVQTPLAENQGDLHNYYTVNLSPGVKADDIARELKKLDTVETAYAKPLPAPTPVTSDFSAYQTHLSAAPYGLAVNATIGGNATTMAYPGSNGSKVRVADLEYSWNSSHEDISRARATGALWANGTPVDPFANSSHGTAVAGIISADRNGLGIDGIVSGASFHMVNTNNAERGWDIANAIYLSANNMSAGDIILLEQQAWAPDGEGYAPIETYQDVYDAIVYATAKGITVIEPAGNGKHAYWQGYDLSDPQFEGIFTTARPSSNAVMVGASATSCSGIINGARMAFSNYGTRVNVRAPGECVTTTGYGDLFYNDSNTAYTSYFSGTSSASAIIAGVAAELSSSYEQINETPPSPAQLRTMLVTGGTPQYNLSNPGKIGVMPNMAKSLPLTDISKPTAPSTLTGTSPSLRRIAIKWLKSNDNLGYVKYTVYRNNIKIATTTNLAYTDATVKSGVSYSYKIIALDASNNASLSSNTVTIKSR